MKAVEAEKNDGLVDGLGSWQVSGEAGPAAAASATVSVKV